MRSPLHARLPFVSLACILVGAAHADDKYVVTISPSKVMRCDGVTGAVIDPSYCDIDGLLGFGGAFRETREGVFPGNGELLVTNRSLGTIHRFSEDGANYLGDVATVGIPIMLAVANGRLWVTDDSNQVSWYDLATYAPIGSTPLADPRDVFPFNGELLVTEWGNGPIVRIDPANGSLLGNFATPGGLNYQMAELASGNLLVAEWGPPGYHVLTPAGALVASTPVGFGQPEGIAELEGGLYLIATQQGVRALDPVSLTSTIVHPGPALSVFDAPRPGTIGTPYCAAAPNSTGVPGTITATGSTSVASNDVTLIASDLPSHAFGYFLTSQTQGFVANPGGSQGNLCLAGGIGRFVGPGQVQSSGAAGAISLALDLTMHPTPGGLAPVSAGETWNFTLWHRDLNPGVTSNFTGGLEVAFD